MQDMAIQKLSEHNIKPSLQRIAVYSYLLEKKNHPTVDMIYSDLHPSMPTLSKTTVYNTLKLFIENNLVQTILIDDEELRYDAEILEHIHFKCTNCKSIHDIFVEQNPPKNNFRPEFSLPEGFKANKTQYNIWGICPNCKQS